MDTNGDLYITAKKTQLNLKVHNKQLSTKDPLSQYSIRLKNIINSLSYIVMICHLTKMIQNLNL